MHSNYFIIVLRKMKRNKMTTVINVLGLSLGISCALMIAVLLRFDLSFNGLYPKKDRLYRVVTDETNANGALGKSSSSPGGIAEAMLKEFPEVEQATVMLIDEEGLFAVRHGDSEKKFKEKRGVVRALPAFFEMFDIPMVEGVQGLKEPNTVVLARSISEKFFGKDPAIGNTIRWQDKVDLKVVGIVDDPPPNSDFDYTIFISGADLNKTDAWMFDWRNLSSNVQTFALLRDQASASHVEAQFSTFKEKYMQQVQFKREYRLQPLARVHYEPAYADHQRLAVSTSTLAALGMIGLFLILTACVNFVNMATAQATNRAREVGVRKVLGAFRRQIAVQFLGETFFVVLISTALSVAIAELVFPFVTEALDIPVRFDLSDPVILLFLAVLTIAMTMLSGFYPALVLSGFLPAAALKGRVSTGGQTLRRGLVVVQFVISQMLMVGTLVVILQMKHVKTQDMGLQTEGVLTVPLPDDNDQLQTLKTRLREDSRVGTVTFSWSSAISNNSWDTNARYEKNGEMQLITTDLKFADEDYLATYGLTLLAGRNYAPADTIKEFVVNEAFVHRMGIQNPADAIGTVIRLGQREPMPIVGVVKNFNARSLHEAIRPCMMAPRRSSYSEIGIKVQTADLHGAIAHIEKVWTAAFPRHIFEREFLDERIASFYEQEKRVEFLFGLFAPIAIFIGCVGLVGLVSFIAAQKTKEIGVRKVLGASIPNILMMFSKEFVQLIALAFVVAAPVSYYVMNGWLENFAYRITIGPLIFAMVLTTTMIVAAVTVGYRAAKTAWANPVEALRYE